MKINEKKKYWIDLIMFFSLSINAITGLLIWFFYSPRPFCKHLKILGLSKYDLKILHIGAGLILLLFVLIHIFFHKKWILKMTKTISKK